MAEIIYRLPKLKEATGLSTSTIYAMIADGAFPKPIKLGLRAVGWPETEINAWLDIRKAKRNAGEMRLTGDG